MTALTTHFGFGPNRTPISSDEYGLMRQPFYAEGVFDTGSSLWFLFYIWRDSSFWDT